MKDNSLNDEGTSLQALQDQVRRDEPIHLPARPKRSVKRIAMEVAFWLAHDERHALVNPAVPLVN